MKACINLNTKELQEIFDDDQLIAMVDVEGVLLEVLKLDLIFLCDVNHNKICELKPKDLEPDEIVKENSVLKVYIGKYLNEEIEEFQVIT